MEEKYNEIFEKMVQYAGEGADMANNLIEKELNGRRSVNELLVKAVYLDRMKYAILEQTGKSPLDLEKTKEFIEELEKMEDLIEK